jgi:addiction module HigA family antidote
MAIMAIHPGEHLQEELEAMSMTAAEFARQLAVPANRITQILKGERDVSADTAMRLGHFFGMSAQFWLGLQALYDLRVAEMQSGRAIKLLPTLKKLKMLKAA